MALRWGIVGSGKICFDFTNALNLLPEADHKVIAVASRSIDSSQKFAEKFNIPKFYGSYEEMAKSKDIDIAYIGVIHPKHYDMCKLFINEGYHVLCEKPMTMNANEAREIFTLAKEKNVFFMEACWSRFFPIYEDLRTVIKSGSIGEVQHVTASFGDNILEDIPRIYDKDLGGGSLLDLGCYPIQFAQMIFNDEKPHKIVASGFINEKFGVDETVSAILHYTGNRMAIVSCSSKCQLDQLGTICGSKPQDNIIQVPNLWSPITMTTPDKKFDHPLPKSKFPMNFRRSEGLMYEAEAVRDCINKGLKEHPLMTWQMSLQIQEIMDEIRKQIGMSYDQDKI